MSQKRRFSIIERESGRFVCAIWADRTALTDIGSTAFYSGKQVIAICPPGTAIIQEEPQEQPA